MAESGIKIIKPQEGGQELFVRSNVDIAIFGGVLAGGKCQPYDSKVFTPFGFRKMGDLKVGDIISRRNGQFQKVIAIYEKGYRDVIELEFADGRKVECCEEHLWNVRRAHSRNKRFQKTGDYEDLWEVMTTEQIMHHLDTKKSAIYIPNCGDVAITKAVKGGRNIHPYLLGALLGDGCLVSTDSMPKLTCADPEMIDYIRELGYKIDKSNSCEIDYKLRDRSAYEELKRIGLLGHRAETKFIPYIYLHGSVEDRISLLQGLLDTDGTIDTRGHIEFDSVSEQLAKDVQWLVWSFGGLCTMTSKMGSYRLPNGEKKICQKVYRLYIRLRDARRFFVLSRKRERAVDKIHIGNDNFETAIKSYKRLGIKKQMRCIRVSSPDSLYLTDNFIVTHNTFGAILANGEPFLDPNYRAVFFRRTLGELKTAGGVVDEFEHAYGNSVTITKSENPRVVYKNTGAWIECRQIADENPNKVRETFKGAQWDAAFFEELTGFQFYTFNYLASRVRGKAGWSGKVRATTNPSKHHWVRKMLAWYIDDATGLVPPEKSGIVRYVYLDGKNVEDYVWGDTKEEVYRKCKVSIDKKLAKMNDDSLTYENFIKSFTFILGNISENKALLEKNPDYVGNVSGDEGDALLMGSWNYDPDEDGTLPINQRMARSVNENDPQISGSKWLCVDLADTGTNTTCIGVFDGLHWEDADILGKSTPKENAQRIRRMAMKHDIPDSRIIYDAQRAAYMLDYIPNAVPYYSFGKARGLYKREYLRRKDENFARLIEVINRGEFSISPEVADMTYERTKLGAVTFMQKFISECGVVQWTDDNNSGKKRLLSKKEMISKLGKGESTDVLDTLQMLMSVYECYEFGMELEVSRGNVDNEEVGVGDFDIYDDSSWA